MNKIRLRLAQRLRFAADHIHPSSAFRCTCMTFYFRDGHGIVVDQDGHDGCPLWYRGDDDYAKAHAVTTPRSRPVAN